MDNDNDFDGSGGFSVQAARDPADQTVRFAFANPEGDQIGIIVPKSKLPFVLVEVQEKSDQVRWSP